VKRSFIIEAEMPAHVTATDMKDFILKAIEGERDRLKMRDPLNKLDMDKVRIVASWVQ
jgi:hypothetical protein